MYTCNMKSRHTEFHKIKTVLEEADEPMTAREILDQIESESFDSSHQIATILGTRAQYGDVDVIRERPYQYQI